MCGVETGVGRVSSPARACWSQRALLQVLELRRHPSAVRGHEGTGAITRDNASPVLRLFRSLGHIQNPSPVLAALPGIVLSRLK